MTDNTCSETGFAPQWATHPGDHLQEYLEIKGWSQAEFGRMAGMTAKLVSEIINKKNPVTAETAMKLERVLGMKADMWLKIQSLWDLHQARSAPAETLEETKTWLKQFPLKELKERGVLPNVTIRDALLLRDALLKFLGIGAPSGFDELFANFGVQHRQSATLKTSDFHIACWLKLVEQQARAFNLPPYNRDKFLKAVQKIRGMTVLNPQEFEPRMRALCEDSGVALILEPAISKTGIYGSTRWLDGKIPVIQMSLRMKYNDHFWWTFFHETGHVLLHEGKTFLEVSKQTKNDCEKEADDWAKEQLIGQKNYDSFKIGSPCSVVEVTNFAQEHNIHPGIIVGMLQHDKIIPFSNLNKLRVKFEWKKS